MDCGPFAGCFGEAKEGSNSQQVTIETPDRDPCLEKSVESVVVDNSLEPQLFGGWNDAAKADPSDTVKKGGILKRALSNLSMGSTGSKKSVKSSASGSSRGSSKNNFIAKRWSMILDSSVPNLLNNRSIMLKDDERVITFDETNKLGCVNPTSMNDMKDGRPNRLRTTKFTPLTWLPLSLINQFKRVANIYFLFIACLVVWPWSPKNWKSKIFPFVGVLLWTALKDLFEDVRRKLDDDAENTQKTWRLSRGSANEEVGGFEEVNWSQVLVGDMVLVPEDTAFPADLILLHPAGNTEAFISTVMLDGETSLKARKAPSLCEVMSAKCAKQAAQEWQAVQSTQQGAFPSSQLKTQMLKFIQGLRRPGVEFKFPRPTPVLSDVRGTLQPSGNAESELVCPFTEDNFLPRGCVLRNTPFVLAVVLFVGDDTKTRMNASTSKMKFSNMQVNLNNCVRGLLLVLFSMCIVATIISFADQGGLAEDLNNMSEDARNPLIRFFMFCITFYHVVPMSLYVIYEMLKLVLAFQVNSDKQMYDPVRNENAKARTAEIMEEMGQVNFLFSDKTGTLTANEMVFARCHVGDQDLGEFRKAAEGGPGAGVLKAREILESGQTEDPLFKSVLNLFTCLAVCHSVQVNVKGGSDDGKTESELSFSGMSPDEVALVQIADDVGIRFVSRIRKAAGNMSEVVLMGPSTSERKFSVLHELAFSSDRKRMSVIVKHKGGIWCITKGADSIMEGLLSVPFTEACAADLNTFSQQGLRTLIVGMRCIEQAEFDAWSLEYIAARNIIDDTQEAKMAEVGAKLEKGLKFVGVTAVEDRLQDGVPEAISIIKEAGIRLWVLTGDKTETAVDIARSCKLFTETTTMAYATQALDAKDAEDKLLKAHSSLDGKGDTGLVLDGQTLLHALDSQECRKIIYDLGIVSRSCICSRLSPMQKLELVKLVREQNKLAITLAIGDGANDVPMIQGAHLGIAIRGKEGTQAVQASDIAISYFRFLVPLLLCHGRRSYRRVALFLSFYLFKNVALLMCDVWWMFQDKFRARIAFPEYLSVGFNVLYSAWHILFVLGFDRDIKDEIAVTRPALYKVGPSRQLFNSKLFARWMFFGVVQGSIAWAIPFAMIGTYDYDKTQPGQFWVCSTAAFTAINVIVWVKLMLYCESPLALTTIVPTVGAFLCYIMALACLGYTPPGKSFQPSMWHVPGDVFGKTENLVAIAAASAAALLLDVVVLLLSFFVWPSELSRAKRGR